MVPTRRQALRGGVALLAALAGCSSSTDTPPPDDTDGSDRSERPGNVAMDPPAVTLRRPGSREPIVTVPDADGDADRAERERRRAVERGFVTTSEAASLLRIEDIEGVGTARQFLEETDFETEFVFVDRRSVRQCYEQVLCYVTWSAFELRRTYAEVYRDYDVACSADERDRVARFVRLEGSVDARRIEPGGSHTKRGGCPIPRWQRGERARDRDETHTASDTRVGNRTTDTSARLTGWGR